jgi:hypothetical protein
MVMASSVLDSGISCLPIISVTLIPDLCHVDGSCDFPRCRRPISALLAPVASRKGKGQRSASDSLQATRSRRYPKRVLREWIEIRSEAAYCKQASMERHPYLKNGSIFSRTMLHVWSYVDCFRKDCLKRTQVGIGLMFFQRTSTTCVIP